MREGPTIVGRVCVRLGLLTLASLILLYGGLSFFCGDWNIQSFATGDPGICMTFIQMFTKDAGARPRAE